MRYSITMGMSTTLFPVYIKPSLEKSEGLLRVFENIHNHIYANDGLSSDQGLEEMIKILFIKIFDEKNKDFKFKVSVSEYEDIMGGGSNKVFLNRFESLQKNTFDYFSDVFEESERIKLKKKYTLFHRQQASRS